MGYRAASHVILIQPGEGSGQGQGSGWLCVFPLSPFHPFLTCSSSWEGASRQGESELRARMEGGECPNLVAGIHKLPPLPDDTACRHLPQGQEDVCGVLLTLPHLDAGA